MIRDWQVPGRGTLVGAALIVVTATAIAVASLADALPLLLLGLIGVAGTLLAILRPSVLFFAYCAAIPFNFALPPGPAGTIARIAGLIFFVGYLIRKPDSLRPNTIPLAGWAFVAWALASTLWAIDTASSFTAWQTLVQLFAISVLIASLVAANPAIVGGALWSYSLSATAIAIIGVLGYFGGPAVFLGRAAAFGGQDPALFASLLLPAAIFLLGEVQSRATTRLGRLVAATAFTACAGAVLLSGTRSAWVGLLVATVVWIMLRRERRQVLAVGALAFGIVLLIVATPGASDFLFTRAETSLQTGGSGRTEIWAVGLGILESAPIVGVGYGNFPQAFTPYAVSQVTVASEGLGVARGPHNLLLGISVETGAVGIVLLVIFLALALVRSNGDRMYDLMRVAMISLLAQSLFLDIFHEKQFWLLLAITFGLAASRGLDLALQPKSTKPKSTIEVRQPAPLRG